MGRHSFEPTDEERKKVEDMAGFGVPFEHIAALVRDGIDTDTLALHFKSELLSGKAKTNGKVGQTLFQKCMDGDTTALIWWTKTQMRWREIKEVKIGGDQDNPVVIKKDMSSEEIKAELLKRGIDIAGLER